MLVIIIGTNVKAVAVEMKARFFFSSIIVFLHWGLSVEKHGACLSWA